MYENWGYNSLYKSIRKQALDEMCQTEWLIKRILFLHSLLIVSKLNQITIGKTVSEMISNDNSDEIAAIPTYKEAIYLFREVDDQGTVDLQSKILSMEEDPVEWEEIQPTQIKQRGHGKLSCQSK
jgi:bacterioferritin